MPQELNTEADITVPDTVPVLYHLQLLLSPLLLTVLEKITVILLEKLQKYLLNTQLLKMLKLTQNIPEVHLKGMNLPGNF